MLTDRCKVCGGEFHEDVLIYENMPRAAQNFPDKDTLLDEHGQRLKIVQCEDCGLIQSASKPVSYFRDVIRATGLSTDMAAFRRQQFAELQEHFGFNSRRLIEIGSGCGEYLNLMTQAGWNVSGVEHLAASVEIARGAGFQVEQGFLESEDTLLEGAPYDAFACFNFLEHIPEIKTWLKAVRNNLSSAALGLVEVPNFDMLIREKLSTEFVADHLYYFTQQSLRLTLESNGFDVIEIKPIWHEYILSAVVQKRRGISFDIFETSEARLKEALAQVLKQHAGKRFAVWGAGHQSLATMAQTGLSDKIEYVIDSAPFKQGKYTPATHVPIMAPSVLNSTPVDVIFIIAAAFSEEISEQIQREHGSKFTLYTVGNNGVVHV